MDNLLLQIAAGIVVAFISGVVGFIVKKRFFREFMILPLSKRQIEGGSYSHLNGAWHLYWLSYSPTTPAVPRWMHGRQELSVQDKHVKGTSEFVNHIYKHLHFQLQGEIRSGRMIIVDSCIENETEFASVSYPNLRSSSLLTGIWSGLDPLLRPVAGPVVLSRKELSAAELNEYSTDSGMLLIPTGKYDSFDAVERPS